MYKSNNNKTSDAVITIFTRIRRDWEEVFDEAISMFLSIYGKNVKNIVEMYKISENYDKTNPNDKLLWPLDINKIMKCIND